MLLDAGLSLDAKNDQDWTVLHFAAFSGHPKTVEFLLKKESDPHLVDNSRCTAYHLAASNGSGNILNPLLEDEKGGVSGMHVSDTDGFKPAQLAVVNNNSGFIGELLKHIDMRELAVEEEPFLLFVARTGSAKMMRVVLRSNPDVFVRGNDQSTILHAMAEHHTEFQSIISDIIKKGVSRSDARNDGSLPLHVLLSGRQPVTKSLVDMMIEGDPNRVDGKHNNYLMCLLRSHRPASLKKDTALDLIKLGVDAFQKNDEGNFFYHRFTNTIPESALQIIPHINNLGGMDKVHWMLSGWLTIHFAIIEGDLSLVKLLLEKGSCLSKQTGTKVFNVSGQQFCRDRLNCMHVAALYGRKDILEYVLGASNLPINCRDGGGGTALHLAAFHGSDDCVKLLLSKGADAKLRDGRGDNALHYAVVSKALPIIEMLVEAGTPMIANHKGESPIDLAIGKGHNDIAELLGKYQASGEDDGDHDLSRVDEIQEVVSLDLPFRFGSKKNHYTFGFNSHLTLDLSKAQ
jgi:ankyrin repeat protein